MKRIRIFSFSGPYSIGIWENTDQKNWEYGHFSLVTHILKLYQKNVPIRLLCCEFRKISQNTFLQNISGKLLLLRKVYFALFTETTTRLPIFYLCSNLASEHEALNYNELSWCAYREKDMFVRSWDFWISLENKTIISYSIIITRPE